MHILLVGKTGSGKSSTANTLLKEQVFKTKAGKSVSKVCYPKPKTIDGRTITVIDTPGYLDTDGLEVAKEINSFILHCLDGIDVIALVLTAAWRPTKETRESIEILETQLGADMRRFLLVVVTRANELAANDMTVEKFVLEYAENCEESTANVLKDCVKRGRVVGLNNNMKKNSEVRESQWNEFFQKAEEISMTNNGSFYTKEMLEKRLEENRKKEEEHQQQLQEARDRERREEEEFRKNQAEMKASKERQEALARQIEEGDKKLEEERQKLAVEKERASKEFEDYQRQHTAEMRQMNDNIAAMKDQTEKLQQEAEQQTQKDSAESARLQEELKAAQGALKEVERKREEAIKLENEKRQHMKEMAEKREKELEKLQQLREEARKREQSERQRGFWSALGGAVVGLGVGLLTRDPEAAMTAGTTATSILRDLPS